MYLDRLLPNIGGPDIKIHRLNNNVIRSTILYGTPIWADHIRKKSESLYS